MKLEDYIQNIRPLLDIERPDEDHIWAGISQSLYIQAKKKRINHLCYAILVSAMVAIAFIAGYHVTKISKHPREKILLYQDFTIREVKQEKLLFT